MRYGGSNPDGHISAISCRDETIHLEGWWWSVFFGELGVGNAKAAGFDAVELDGPGRRSPKAGRWVHRLPGRNRAGKAVLK